MSDTSRGPSGPIEHDSQQASETDVPAAATARPDVIRERHPASRANRARTYAVIAIASLAIGAGGPVPALRWLAAPQPEAPAAPAATAGSDAPGPKGEAMA